MAVNPNAYFYRHVAPDQVKRNGAWTASEKRLFLEAVKIHPPSTGKWGLFATHIPGRVGYQCRNFYHRLLETGELKADPGELRAIRRTRNSKRTRRLKRKVTSEVGNEEKESEDGGIESLVLFSSRLRENPSLEESEEEGEEGGGGEQAVEETKEEEEGFEYEASAILRSNRDNPLNMLLLSPPGGLEGVDEYINAIRWHLVRDTQAEKDRLMAAYFRATEASGQEREALVGEFVQAVVRSAR
jgi:hypothetical protein